MKGTATKRALEPDAAASQDVGSILIVKIKSTDPATDKCKFEISKSRNQQVKWETESGEDFTVEFEGESPFYEKQFNQDFPYSGLIRRSVLGDHHKRYPYTVRVAGREVDPHGIIDP